MGPPKIALCMVLARVQDWLGVFCSSPFDGRPQGGGHLEPPARDSSGGYPGFIYPLGPGTFIRTDHFAQPPSLRRLDGSALRCRSVVHALVPRSLLREREREIPSPVYAVGRPLRAKKNHPTSLPPSLPPQANLRRGLCLVPSSGRRDGARLASSCSPAASRSPPLLAAPHPRPTLTALRQSGRRLSDDELRP